MHLTNGSGFGSCYFRHWPSRRQQKTNQKSFSAYYFLKVHLHNFSKKVQKKSQNSRNQGFLKLFLLDERRIQIREAQKQVDPDSDPEHCIKVTDRLKEMQEEDKLERRRGGSTCLSIALINEGSESHIFFDRIWRSWPSRWRRGTSTAASSSGTRRPMRTTTRTSSTGKRRRSIFK